MSRQFYKNLNPSNWAAIEADPNAPQELKDAIKYLGKSAEVKLEHLPALRAIIRKQFPSIRNNPHARARLEAFSSRYLGNNLSGYLNSVSGLNDFSNATSNASNDPAIKRLLDVFKQIVDENTVEGARGFGSEETTSIIPRSVGKETLAAHYPVAGADAFDTPIQAKVEATVNADFFGYQTGSGDTSLYNKMYLKDAQWQKQMHFNPESNVLPRSGNDQLYFQSWELNPNYLNQQPVEMDLTDDFEKKLYATQVKNYEGNAEFNDPLKDLKFQRDPLMEINRDSHFVPLYSLQSDVGFGFNKDPAHPQYYNSAPYLNEVGLRDTRDSLVSPYTASQFKASLHRPPEQAFKRWQQDGTQSYSS